jgi:hypothetical protein
MQQRTNKGDHTGSNFCHFIEGECPRCRGNMDDRGNEIHEPRRGYQVDQSEVQYDYYLTLAKMWDDPHQDFDIKLDY